MKNLFQKKKIDLSSGIESDFKIECDALTDKDWECIAFLISKHLRFKRVVSVPTGGDKLAKLLEQYAEEDNEKLPVMICDDVLTTGASMNKVRDTIDEETRGVVAFSRGICPAWITPVFQLWGPMIWSYGGD